MKSYLALAPKYLAAHKEKTRLTVISVVLAVTLVSGIFSMLDSLIKFERNQVLKDEGNYHLLVRKPANEDISYIKGRIDIKNSGILKDLGEGTINGEKCALGALDENFAPNLNFVLSEGHYPTGENEIMLEKWFMEKSKPVLKIGDTVSLSSASGMQKAFTISGTYRDWGATKAAGIPIVFLSVGASESLTPKSCDYFILFKDGVSVPQAEAQIKKALQLTSDRVARNERLLAFTLQSRNSRVLELYVLGAVLFFLVLITGVVMIYNTFNLSVMERVRQFGLLRCIGASPSQIRTLVRGEGFSIALRAIPIGVLAGMAMTLACSAVLKYFNSSIFGGIPLFRFSAAGTGIGVIMGFLTVYIASLLPAKKAARVSPVNALAGSSILKGTKSKKQGLLTKMLHAEIAIGLSTALNKKKTLFLMSCSVALSIILFFGFSVLVNPEYMGMRPIKSYTADLSLTSIQGIDESLYNKLLVVEGVKRVYGRRAAYVDAKFDAGRLTDWYKRNVNGVKVTENGLFTTPEKSWLLSYDKTQLEWLKEYMREGQSDENQLNAQNGIIAVEKNRRRGSLIETTKLHRGDKVQIQTPSGVKEFTVMGICDSIPYESEELTLTTWITTEKLLAGITTDTAYEVIDLQLKGKNQEQTVHEIKAMAGTSASVLDKRQFNAQAKSTYMTTAVFIYGFVGVIVLISILNIINTMNTSVAAKTKYLGVMRAVGMTELQLSGMVLTEAVIYIASGCFVGCTLGIMLQKRLVDFFLADWSFPWLQVLSIFTLSLLVAVLSVLSPLKRLGARGISEVISSL